MRNRFAGRIGAGGIVIFALARDLVALVVATAFLVHIFEMLLEVPPRSAACSTA
jgi:hypothetical protein